MARLYAFGGDNGTHELDALDTVGLQAQQLARDSGHQWQERRPLDVPTCPRTGCGGAIVSSWNDACILCARNGGTGRTAGA
ncbi:MAG: hypothetical protein E6I38_07355 [Chloroflexi bacterium]|nr:MAG: hypothetical protein E6I38_07355 [Chloroflexota bacterium]